MSNPRNKRELLQKISKDISVELQSHVDDNFRSSSFYGQKWKELKSGSSEGTILVKTAQLRNSLRYTPHPRGVVVTSSKPYAQIHNQGGTIKQRITDRQRRWAWRQFYLSKGKNLQYKAMALTRKTTRTLNVPARPFVGAHPKLREAVAEISEQRLKQYADELMRQTFDNLKKDLKRR